MNSWVKSGNITRQQKWRQQVSSRQNTLTVRLWQTLDSGRAARKTITIVVSTTWFLPRSCPRYGQWQVWCWRVPIMRCTGEPTWWKSVRNPRLSATSSSPSSPTVGLPSVTLPFWKSVRILQIFWSFPNWVVWTGRECLITCQTSATISLLTIWRKTSTIYMRWELALLQQVSAMSLEPFCKVAPSTA